MSDERAWLITWNVDNWYWEKYNENCEIIRNGGSFIERWSCTNGNPQIGDEVYLIKLGKPPRGLIGHGIVASKIYEDAHYDPIKAAKGKKVKFIDVKFDKLINYKQDTLVSQDELKSKCSQQHWSPQNSGIEIKAEVLPMVRSLWNNLFEKDNTHNTQISLQQTDNYQLGEFYSWNLLQADVAIKKGDKSFFEHGGSAIPKEIKWFFECDRLKTSESKSILFDYQGKQYTGRIMNDPLDRCRIYWNTELSEAFQSYYHTGSTEYPLIRFQRTAPDCYQIAFLDGTLITATDDSPLETVFIPQKEGSKKEYYVSKYERNPVNRKNAILIHGTRCMACGFDFESFYGEAGRNFIEVHHIKPLSDIGDEITIDPARDLICVCSNCHRIIHKKKNGVYTLDEVRAMIEATKLNGK